MSIFGKKMPVFHKIIQPIIHYEIQPVITNEIQPIIHQEIQPIFFKEMPTNIEEEILKYIPSDKIESKSTNVIPIDEKKNLSSLTDKIINVPEPKVKDVPKVPKYNLYPLPKKTGDSKFEIQPYIIMEEKHFKQTIIKPLIQKEIRHIRKPIIQPYIYKNGDFIPYELKSIKIILK